MINRAVLALIPVFLAATSLFAEEPGPADFAAVAEAVTPSLVRVEYTLRYDKGEPPRAGGWVQGGCPVRGRDSLDAEDPVKEERPMELAGFLVGPTQVVSIDPIIHPRFVESIAVRFRDDVVKARPAAYGRDQRAVILELERPLKGAKPLAFDAARKPPYMVASYGFTDGSWTVCVESMPTGLSVTESGRKTAPAPLEGLVVDRGGGAVALSMKEEIPTDDSWKGPPSGWAVYSADEMTRMLAAVEEKCKAALPSVTLYFRSPRKDARRQFRTNDEEKSATEQHATGILVGGNRVLVLVNLKPNVTARLDRIVVVPAQGEPVPARFTASLADYGCLVATLEKPLAGGATFSAKPILECRGAFLPVAEIRQHGENRTLYFDHRRIEGFNIGWRRQIYPALPGEAADVFLFDPQGALLTMPVARREKVSIEEGYSSREPMATPVAYLKNVLDDLPKYADAHNVPLTEEQESRLAWLGMELQPLNRDLARANQVSELTRDGETGALVSHVYPGSPAAKAGIEPGFILLRLRVEGQPKPLEVRMDREDLFEGPFPWDELDEVSEQFYERIPSPWPPVENSFTRAMTDLGFGTKFKAEFFHDGQTVAKDFEVVQSPPHYESAARYKSQALGLTVRDMTYEVRRYFQKKDDEPGVIVSKIEPGSKASVAGVKPYEIITNVNDKPVMNVKDFEGAIAAQEELRLAVKRMTRGRVVKIKMDAAAKAAQPEKPAAAEKPTDEKPAAKEGADSEKPSGDDTGKTRPDRRPRKKAPADEKPAE